jgi:hypothetical protein
MEKVFALKDSKITPTLARYHTLQWGATKPEVEYIFLNKKYDWVNRAKEECFRCTKCKMLIMPKDQKVHKTLCKVKKEVPNEVDNDRVGIDTTVNMG